MPPSKSSRKQGGRGSNSNNKGGGEVQVQKSPAEFFAENQAIAGFDNLGKSLYTSIRELMENSLDACESIGVLPSIQVHVEELTLKEFNDIRGISTGKKDVELFHNSSAAATSQASANASSSASKKKRKKGEADVSTGKATAAANPKKARKKASQEAYFRIVVRDNGCGMKHDKIPDLLGRVLSGSKYGVRQTRGKFGLGAKMALIWSRKSAGMPITITTSHRPKSTSGTPSHYSVCVLDIDISKNIPRIIQHDKKSNAKEEWKGTKLELLIGGNWTTYRGRIVSYLQQLAIITPYAQLELTYENRSEPQRNTKIRYDRRSEQMPDPAKEVKHHPSSVNNLVIQQLLERSNHDSVSSFLEHELSSVSKSVANRIVKECGWDDEDMHPSDDLTDRDITKLVQVLRTVQLFKAPDGSCLSPLGEYNLNLGIRKVLEPDYVATARDRACAYEGHPFVVEAAVSLGGKEAKEGIQVFRFANRIPLLFEAGADVSTRVAQSKIKWTSYKMDHKRDKIGVFVSIVSTKIPYKGTGKEYIGDDITEISASVKRALQSCCQQLRTHLLKRNALRDQRERKNRLTKYIPDVTRALHGLLEGMRERYELQQDPSITTSTSPRKRPRLTQGQSKADVEDMIGRLESGAVNETVIRKSLEDAVNIQNDLDQQVVDSKTQDKEAVPLYLVPQFDVDQRSRDHDINHPLFVFRPMRPISP